MRETHIAQGAPDAVDEALGKLQHLYCIDEFIVDNPVTDTTQRLTSEFVGARARPPRSVVRC